MLRVFLFIKDIRGTKQPYTDDCILQTLA